MNIDLLLKSIGITKEQVLLEVPKINLNFKEEETFKKGIEFINKFNEIETEVSRKNVIMKIIFYELIRRNGEK